MAWNCSSCGGPLQTRTEKMTKTCKVCAQAAHDGFELMAKGRMKEGFNKVIAVRFANDPDRQQAVEKQMKKAIKSKRRTIEKKLKKKVKKGEMTLEQMEQGLKEFDEMADEDKAGDEYDEQQV